MGRTNVQNLINRGSNWNSYNATGIATNGLWLDAFNAALADLVEDIGLTARTVIPYIAGTTTYDLPADFFESIQVVDAGQFPIWKRQYEVEPFPCADSYYIKNVGANYQIVFDERNSSENITVVYTRYPSLLNTLTDFPEVPTVGEDALLYYAISRSLRNNNQQGQAMEVEQKYEQERKKIRDAKYRAAAGW